MKDEKKVNKAEEVKEEKGVELTDEQMAEVNGGLTQAQIAALIAQGTPALPIEQIADLHIKLSSTS